MSKLHLIVKLLNSSINSPQRSKRPLGGLACWVLLTIACVTGSATAQDEKPGDPDAVDAKVTYPRAVALSGEDLFVVDLDLPGIWKVSGEKRELYSMGTKLLRKPMNRPWSVVSHPGGGILVGDSATREVYAIESAGAKAKPLTNGHIGIPMALAVSADGKTIYVGDAEKRAVLSIPIDGVPLDDDGKIVKGKEPKFVARVNARALSFDEDGGLWAITPDAAAVQKIDVSVDDPEKSFKTVVGDRPYQFPNGLVWVGDHGYVTDGYGKSIWKFTADGKTEKWYEGDALGGPVGITANDKSVFVADPKKKQILEFDRETKKVTERL